jgi:beta-mannosidase
MKSIAFFLLTGLVFFTACSSGGDDYRQLTLDSGWEFRQAGESGWRTATVPGSVHGDLLQHGLIPDLFYRANEDSIQWIEKADWEYRTRFNPDAAIRNAGYMELDFKGLDTYADVYLNDSLVLQADNMFIAWQVPVSGLLRPGENELRIYFHSPVNRGMEKLRQLPYILKATNEQAPEDQRTNVFTRKAPFHYGWDWGPRLVTSGIWRPVQLRAWSLAAIEDVYIEKISVNPERAEYKAHITVKALQPGEYGARLGVQGLPGEFSTGARLEPGVHVLTVPFAIDNPSLWWSHGLGEPHLYTLDIGLLDGSKKIDGRSQRIGVRDIQLVQEPDSAGRSFRFELNGVPVFMKGANYIPSHTITPMVTPDVYRRVIADAVAANMNMLRVWGGAIYEEDLFYDLCDENGILVWQDFMFACALMPADEQHWDNIRKEAEYNVRRLRNHPGMALWCGNNENLTAWHHWGWKEAYPDSISQRLWEGYEKIFYQILRQAVADHHPS